MPTPTAARPIGDRSATNRQTGVESLERLVRDASRDAARLIFAVQAGLSREADAAVAAVARMGRLLAYSMLAADLSGRLEMRDALLRARGRGQRQRPDWVTIQPREAIDYLLQLTPVDLGISTDTVRETYEKMQFRLARGIQQDIVQRTQQQIGSLLHQGKGVRDFQKWARDLQGGHFSDSYAETVFRTETARARSAGQTRQVMEDPLVRAALVAWQWDAVDDLDTRPNHAALDGHAWSIDSPVWDEMDVPAGWNCRCRKVPLTRAAAKRMGRWSDVDGFIDSPWPIPGAGPDPGFETTPVRRIYG